MHQSENTSIDFKSLNSKLEENLSTHLAKFGPRGNDKEIYRYSLIPAGKLFRPTLSALAYLEAIDDKIEQTSVLELFSAKTDISLYASFLETHHVYTLIHDDLPAMDNDVMRRGRAASHIKFNEWKALLTGDGMSILSFHLLSHIKGPRAIDLIRIATKYTGSNGLIYGQFLDLSEAMNESFENVKTTHLFKTARLIQLSLIGGQVIACGKINDQTKQFWRFGESIGLAFQFLDDLDDLREENPHEQEINPWKKYKSECTSELEKCLDYCRGFLENKPLLKSYIQSYLDKNSEMLKQNKAFYIANGFYEKELLNILSRLDLVGHH